MPIDNSINTHALDFSNLSQLKAKSQSSPDDSVREVAEQFESLFTNMMLQAMRKATQKSGLLDSQATDTYQQLFDQEVALSLSRNGSLGIADAIERQIRFSRGTVPDAQINQSRGNREANKYQHSNDLYLEDKVMAKKFVKAYRIES